MSSLREELLAGIRSHREQFEAAGDRAEELRTLPNDAVATLRALGLFWLKTPAELGGTPLSPVEFCDVIEELAYIDTSTAWAAMIGAGCNGLAGGWLPEAGARRIFGPAAGTAAARAGGRRPLPVLAGQLAPRGTGAPTAGGYLVHGRWGFSSGIVHADWLIGAFKADGVAGRAASGGGADGPTADAARRPGSAGWSSSPSPRPRPRSSTTGTSPGCRGPAASTSRLTARSCPLSSPMSWAAPPSAAATCSGWACPRSCPTRCRRSASAWPAAPSTTSPSWPPTPPASRAGPR